jgi:AraC-like DNA-binding protein
MGVVAALLDARVATATLRRTLPRGHLSVLACRHGGQLARALETRLLDAVVVGVGASRRFDLGPLRRRYPAVPLVVFGLVRPDESDRLVELADRIEAEAILLEGLDDPVLGDTVARECLTSRRSRALRDGPRLLRLSEPLQRGAWDLLVRSPGGAATTAALATRLKVSREHLSRQFGAGGAPNLKRVIDLLGVVAAQQLLGNPGYPPASAARLLGYSGPSQLRAVARRVVRLRLRDLARTPVAELLRRFVGGGMRCRP